MTENLFTISEIFGPTLQGEGPHLGQTATFLRLAGCNLHCNFCDTPYTWVFSEKLAAKHRDGQIYTTTDLLRMPTSEVIGELFAHGMAHTRWLVVTGGEPMLQQPGLAELFSAAELQDRQLMIETAGTKYPTGLARFQNIVWSVSPKLASSGNDATRLQPDVLRAYAQLVNSGRGYFKFVCSTKADLAEVDAIVALLYVKPETVYIMPEGIASTTIDANLQYLAEEVIQRGYSLTTRLHVAIWGNKRGV